MIKTRNIRVNTQSYYAILFFFNVPYQRSKMIIAPLLILAQCQGILAVSPSTLYLKSKTSLPSWQQRYASVVSEDVYYNQKF